MKTAASGRLAGRRHPGLFAIFALLVMLLAACTSGLKVRSDVDPQADFSQYHTFSFFDPMGIEGGNNSPVFGEYFREAITNELRERGYRQSARADLMVNVTMRADDRVKVTSYTAPYLSGAYYGGPYYGAGVAVSQTATKTTEVSAFVDLVDAEKQRVVWQGVAVVDVNDKVVKELRNAIFTAVDAVLEQYPYTTIP